MNYKLLKSLFFCLTIIGINTPTEIYAPRPEIIVGGSFIAGAVVGAGALHLLAQQKIGDLQKDNEAKNQEIARITSEFNAKFIATEKAQKELEESGENIFGEIKDDHELRRREAIKRSQINKIKYLEHAAQQSDQDTFKRITALNSEENTLNIKTVAGQNLLNSLQRRINARQELSDTGKYAVKCSVSLLAEQKKRLEIIEAPIAAYLAKKEALLTESLTIHKTLPTDIQEEFNAEIVRYNYSPEKMVAVFKKYQALYPVVVVQPEPIVIAAPEVVTAPHSEVPMPIETLTTHANPSVENFVTSTVAATVTSSDTATETITPEPTNAEISVPSEAPTETAKIAETPVIPTQEESTSAIASASENVQEQLNDQPSESVPSNVPDSTTTPEKPEALGQLNDALVDQC